MRLKRTFTGVIGGLAGGLLFGMMMGMMGMMPMIAKMVGSSSAVVGFAIHMFNSALIGGAYGFLIAPRVHATKQGALFGAGYGILWWLLGPLTLMPLMMGMGLGVNWNIAAASAMLPSLMGHVVYGLALGVVESKVYCGFAPLQCVEAVTGESRA